MQLMGHSANINTSYSERLSYGAYMTVQKASAC
jgi:hypothetical protein